MSHFSRTLVTLGAALALNLSPTLAGLDLATAATTTHKVRTSHQGEGPYVPPPAAEVTTTVTTTTTAPTAPLPPPLLAPAPATGLTQQAQAMVGCWTGTAFQQAAGQEESWLINRRADGTFSITFWALDDEDEVDASGDGGTVTSAYSYAEPAEDMDSDEGPDMADAAPPAGSVYSPEGETESGRWSLDDGLETLVTTAINGVPQPGAARDVYQINRFTGQEIDYTHLATGQSFSTHRVACGYRPEGIDAAPNPMMSEPLPLPANGS